MTNYYLPKDTLEATDRKVEQTKFSNFNQILNNFPYFESGRGTIKAKLKIEEWKFSDSDMENSAYVYKRIREQNLSFIDFCMRPNWRLIVGLGSESVYETSITLHHIYGFPYIPGQAIKGVLRNFIINEYFPDVLGKHNKLEQIEAEIEKDELFIHIFGNQKQQGKIYFFDALPVEKPKISKDVMNPHFSDYYQDSKNKIPPADYLSPVPIFFLTVVDTLFSYNFGVKKADEKKLNNFDGKFATLLSDEFDQNEKISDVIKTIAIRALQESGIGAKTSVGYGSFNSIESLPKSFRDKLFVLKSDKEKKEENFMELIENVKNGFKVNEGLKLFLSKEATTNDKDLLHKLLVNVIFDETIYETLQKNQSHYDLINTVLDDKNNLKPLFKEFDQKFDSIIKLFGSKKQKEQWKKMNNNHNEQSSQLPLISKDYESIKKSVEIIKSGIIYEDSKLSLFSRQIRTFVKSKKGKKLKPNKKKEMLKWIEEIITNNINTEEK